jgi:hypothetical protein
MEHLVSAGEEPQTRRDEIAICRPGLFAELLQHKFESELAADGVALGADMREDTKPRVRADDGLDFVDHL